MHSYEMLKLDRCSKSLLIDPVGVHSRHLQETAGQVRRGIWKVMYDRGVDVSANCYFSLGCFFQFCHWAANAIIVVYSKFREWPPKILHLSPAS